MGSGNIALGYQAGINVTTNNNIDIGNLGVEGENNIIRIGDPSVQTDTFLAGTVHASSVSATNVSAGNVSASGVSATTSTGYAMLGNASGSAWAGLFQYGYNGNNTVYLGGNGNAAIFYGTVTVNGTFNNNSDRSAKDNFAKVQAADVLAKVARLPVTEWNYKNDAATRHIGPMAQDFYAAFNVGTDERHIAPIDEGGVALAAIQGLNQKVEAENTELKQEVAELKQLVSQLSAKFDGGAQ